MENEKIYTKKELLEKLTPKEKIFCHEYIIDWNGSRAARAAKYSENSAKEIAHSNLTKVHIQQYIEFIKNDIAKETGISKIALINELKILAFSNLPVIFQKYEEGGIDALDESEQRTILEIVDDKTMAGSVVASRDLKIKLHNKIGAIQDILKAMGWNAPEVKEVNLTGDVKGFLPSGFDE